MKQEKSIKLIWIQEIREGIKTELRELIELHEQEVEYLKKKNEKLEKLAVSVLGIAYDLIRDNSDKIKLLEMRHKLKK